MYFIYKIISVKKKRLSGWEALAASNGRSILTASDGEALPVDGLKGQDLLDRMAVVAFKGSSILAS